jgi:hypothetical protein
VIGWLSPAAIGLGAGMALCAAAVALMIGLRAMVPSAPAPGPTDDALPVAMLTPGATWDVTVEELCGGGAQPQRPVPAAVQQQVVRSYGMERVPATEYELDYLITPELGGAADAQNIWPQRYRSRTWNAHVKDQLEELLPRLVCTGAVPLSAAQRDIAVDWIGAYQKYFKTAVPLPRHARLRVGEDEGPITYPVWRSGSAPALQLISLSASR